MASPKPWHKARALKRWARVGPLLIASALAGGCGSTSGSTPRSPSSTAPQADAPPAALVAQSRPIGRSAAFHPPATGPVLGRCGSRLGPRAGVHVEVFAGDRVVLIPGGIGTRPPRRFFSGRISSAGCYGEIVTLDPTGLVLVRPGARPVVADLFRSWGQPLSSQRLLSFRASHGEPAVRAFLNGRRWPGAVGAVPLRPHSEIVLEVGPYVPPHASYTFPPGT